MTERGMTMMRRRPGSSSRWISPRRLPASETRSVNHAFLMNTMALVEMRKGHQRCRASTC